MNKLTEFIAWILLFVTASTVTIISLKLTAIKNHLCEVSPQATELCPNR